MITEDDVLNALKNCRDPEIPLNVVDLGLIYDVKVDDGKVTVKMTLTTPGCPMHSSIKADATKEIQRIPGVTDAEVEIVWDPPWNKDMMSDEGKRKLGID